MVYEEDIAQFIDRGEEWERTRETEGIRIDNNLGHQFKAMLEMHHPELLGRHENWHIFLSSPFYVNIGRFNLMNIWVTKPNI